MIRSIITNMRELKIPCKKVESPQEFLEISRDILETFETINHPAKVGLAANQIGIQKQVALIKIGERVFWLINPILIEKEGRRTYNEACLSLPGLSAQTDRYERIVIENGLKERVQETYEGFEAIVVQHEIDHLKGMTILDRKHRRK